MNLKILRLLAFAMITSFASAQIYTITDLGPLAPAGINSWGQVVGNYNGHAVLWTRFAGLTDLGTLAGGTFSRAAAINDLGNVAGTADGPATVTVHTYVPFAFFQVQCSNLVQPFIWNKATGMQGLGGPQGPEAFPAGWPMPIQGDYCRGFPTFQASGINAFNSVSGYTAAYTDFYQWAFQWTNATGMSLFGGSWPQTLALAISNQGQVVGENSHLMFEPQATSWRGGTITVLAGLGSSGSGAFGVNDLGQVVGWSSTDSTISGDCSTVDAVLWDRNGVIQDLGTLPGDTISAAYKINYFGHVIGSSGNSAIQTTDGLSSALNCFDQAFGPQQVVGRPFVWSTRTGMLDLNSLISSDSGWTLNSVADINVWGQIVGSGTLSGEPHGFLLTPRNPFD